MTEQTVVLVVEDEPLLRMAAADMVEGAGFMPVEAANATEAVRILESLVSGHVNPPRVNLPARTLFFSKPYNEQHVVAAMKELAA